MVALKHPTGNDDQRETIRAYFDPVGLKDSKKVSAIEFDANKPVKAKTAAILAWIELQGPPKLVEAWAKKLDRAKISALLK
jgi:hypothetical protein